MTITLRSNTQYPARYRILQGQLAAALPGLTPGASILPPIENLYTVFATTNLDGNTYTFTPLCVARVVGFLALVKQDPVQQTYAFEVLAVPSSQPNQLEFETSCTTEVVFPLLKDNRPVQSIALTDPFIKSSLRRTTTPATSRCGSRAERPRA